MNLFRDDTDITDGIQTNIWQAIDVTIENNSLESFRVLKDFVRRILHLSIQHQSIKHFQKYIFFPATFYNYSYYRAKERPELSQIYNFCSRQAAIHLKEVIWLDISFALKQAKSGTEKRAINEFYKWAFNGFNRLLYYIVQNNDLAQLKFAMDEYDQISDIDYSNYIELKWQIKNLERENINGEKDKIINKKKESYDIAKAFLDYRRHVLLGIRYWIYFLYRVDKIKLETASAFLKIIRIPYADPDDLIKDILFFRKGILNDYMGWEDWDFEERHLGKVYSPPQPYDWLTFGFLADQIRDKALYVNVNELDTKEIDQAKFLYDDLKSNTTFLEQHFEQWRDLLNKPTLEALHQTSEDILKDFALVKRKSITDTDEAIAEAPLHQPHIAHFKEVIGNSWKAQARIHRMFRQFGNSLNVTGEAIELKRIGQRTFFEKAKMMFTEQNYQWIYGADQMGGQVGRWEDNHFFSKILQGNFNTVTGKTALIVLDNAIKELGKTGIQPDLILMAPEFSYRDQELIDSKRFDRKIHQAEQGNELLQFSIGNFDNIPIYSSFSDFLRNRVVVCNFQQAFRMKYKTNDNWYDHELTVEILPVTDEIAQKKLEENIEKWTKLEDNQVLSNEEALILIKTSVMIDIWTIIDFEVLNKDAYIVGNIKAEDSSSN